ncbi:MAG: hypothetical protein U0822_02515 [Anaerolineae bacterium]
MSASRLSTTRGYRTSRRRDKVQRKILALVALLAVCLVLLARLGERDGPRWYWQENSERPSGAGAL